MATRWQLSPVVVSALNILSVRYFLNILVEEAQETRKKRQIRVLEYSKTEILESPLLCTSGYYSMSSTFTTDSNLISTDKNSKKTLLEKRTSIEKRGIGFDFFRAGKSDLFIRRLSSKNF